MNNFMERNICRLCLRTTFDNCLTITEEIVSEISDVLLLYLNFSMTDNPLMCTECEKNLHKAIGFKCSRKMLPSLYSGEEVIKYFTATSKLVDTKFCYFCINCPTHVRPVPEAEHNAFLLEILQELSTELKMVSTKDAVACNKCFYIIQDILQFMTTCLNVEEKIRRYIEIEAMNYMEQVNLNDVQTFLGKSIKCGFNGVPVNEVEYANKMNGEKSIYNSNVNKIEYVDEMGDETEIQVDLNNFSGMEELQEEIKAGKEGSDIKVIIENENSVTLTVNYLLESYEEEGEYLHPTQNFTPEDIQKVHIKNEEIEIKSENDCDSFLDHNTVQKKKILACELCTYTSKYRHCMERHALSHLSLSEVNLYQCPKCSFGTKYRSGLTRHMITHQDVKEAKIYKCDKCPFQTKHKYGTVKHALVHKDASEIDTFKCLTCNRGFKRKEQLKKHVLTHMKSHLPKFKCDECDYESIWKDHLNVHTLTHKKASEVTMFKCHLCPHETKMKGSLKLHFTTHEKRNRKWHRCKWCRYKSKYEGHVMRHIKDEHENVESEEEEDSER